MVVAARGRELLAPSGWRSGTLLNTPRRPRQLPQSRVNGPHMSIVPRLRNRHLDAGFGLAWGARLNKVQVAFLHLSSAAPTFPRGTLLGGSLPPKQTEASFNDHEPRNYFVPSWVPPWQGREAVEEQRPPATWLPGSHLHPGALLLVWGFSWVLADVESAAATIGRNLSSNHPLRTRLRN